MLLALVLALGALGVGYAAWTDTVTIDGTVNTGDVDIVVESYSGMWMWKIPGGDPDYELSLDPDYTPTGVTGQESPFLVAYSYAAQAEDAAGVGIDDAITCTFHNLFPRLLNDVAVAWEADFVLHYEGSIPVKIEWTPISITPDAGMDLTGLTITYTYKLKRDGETTWTTITDLEGLQLEYCDRIWVVIGIVVPQHATEAENVPNMGQSGTITGQIKVIQWNEYGL
jgi:predicted ribosomally synthesized peptide with SipW-like signal peptide